MSGLATIAARFWILYWNLRSAESDHRLTQDPLIISAEAVCLLVYPAKKRTFRYRPNFGQALCWRRRPLKVREGPAIHISVRSAKVRASSMSTPR